MSVPQEIVEALMAKALEDYHEWGEELSKDEEQELYNGIVNTLELVGPMFKAHALEEAADLADNEDGGHFPIYVTTEWLRELADDIRYREGE